MFKWCLKIKCQPASHKVMNQLNNFTAINGNEINSLHWYLNTQVLSKQLSKNKRERAREKKRILDYIRESVIDCISSIVFNYISNLIVGSYCLKGIKSSFKLNYSLPSKLLHLTKYFTRGNQMKEKEREINMNRCYCVTASSAVTK